MGKKIGPIDLLERISVWENETKILNYQFCNSQECEKLVIEKIRSKKKNRWKKILMENFFSSSS